MSNDQSAELVWRAPPPALVGVVAGLAGYREAGDGLRIQHESAALVVPVIISLGSSFRIALGRAPTSADEQPSFIAGLYPGPVEIRSDGGAECVQINFTPLGAHRFFGGLAGAVASQLVGIEEALGAAGRSLHERLGNAATWDERFGQVEAFLVGRALSTPRPEIEHLCAALIRRGGTDSIGAIAADIGISRKHLADLCGRCFGVGPKSLARMVRFRRACAIAAGGRASWADVAATCGFADQAHLVREFRTLAGATPTQWMQRIGRGTETIPAEEALLR